MPVTLRRRVRSQAGFTLVELLVVMIVLGMLAALALPAFFSQRQKAYDAEAQVYLRTADTAIEIYATDRGGNYGGATIAELQAIEPALKAVDEADLTIGTGIAGLRYRLGLVSSSGNQFWIRRRTNGEILYPCTTAGTGGCREDGSWGGS